MGGTVIKICGITRIEDALCALEAGADWLGFIRFAGSPRFRPVRECAALVDDLKSRAPKPFEAVGVYVDASLETMLAEQREAGFDRIQLHGNEPMEIALGLPVPVIKAIKVASASSINEEAGRYPGLDLLTDAPDPVLHGGTGRTYDPAAIEELVGRRRVIVAGGLTPYNVAGVIGRLRPFGVDVSSGVEVSPGIKDPAKVRAFAKAVLSCK